MKRKNETSKKSKSFFLDVFPLLLIILGITLLIVYAFQNKMDEHKVDDLREAFMTSLVDPVESPNSNNGENETLDIWGILEIESLNFDLPISISGDFSLLYDALVAYDSAPLPPNPGNFTVAGHNGSCAVCTFRYLKDVKMGETVKIINKNQTLYYEVYESFFVLEDELWVLDNIKDETTLTLLTCRYSSWTNPWRLIVRARLVDVIDN